MSHYQAPAVLQEADPFFFIFFIRSAGVEQYAGLEDQEWELLHYKERNQKNIDRLEHIFYLNTFCV